MSIFLRSRLLLDQLSRVQIGGSMRLWPFGLALIASFIWVQPHHYPPWSGFHEDAGMALFVAAVACVMVCMRRIPTEWSAPPILLFMLAGVVWLQWFSGMIASIGQTILFSSTLLGCALTWLFVRHIESKDANLVGDIVFLAIALASILNTGFALFQWLEIDNHGFGSLTNIWIIEQPGKRPAGNIAQPNELATLLMWGMVAGLWAWARGKLSQATFLVYGLFLAIGLALTQSRIGLVQSGLLWLALLFLKRRFSGFGLFFAYSLIFAVQIALFVNLPDLGQWLQVQYSGRDMTVLAKDVARMAIYESAWTAFMQSPWTGYGAAHFATAQWVANAQLLPMNAYYFQTHNWVLDILLWFGMPLGGLLVALILAWGVLLLVRVKEAKHTIFGLALAIFFLHASVELPHWAVIYLLTAVIFAACICRQIQPHVSWKSSRALVGVLTVLCAVIAGRATLEYVRLEENYVKLRAEQLRVRTDISDVPTSFVLTHLADMLLMGRMSAGAQYGSDDLAWMEKTVSAAPLYQNQFTHATSLALAGRKQEASVWMDRLNSSSPKSQRIQYERVWSNYQVWYADRIADMPWTPAKEP